MSTEDRRRDDRRKDFVSLADYTVPELRKALLTMAVQHVQPSEDRDWRQTRRGWIVR